MCVCAVSQLGWVAGPGPSAKGSESTRATAYCPVGAVSHSWIRGKAVKAMRE